MTKTKYGRCAETGKARNQYLLCPGAHVPCKLLPNSRKPGGRK